MTDSRAVVLLVPIAMGGLLVLGTIGWFAAIQFGGTAHGGRATLTFDSSCAALAISARLADYGLEGEWIGSKLTMVLPGMEDDRSHMPAALTAPGVLAIDGAAVRPRHAGVQLSLGGNPVSLYTLDAVVPPTATVTLDGQEMKIEQVNGGELQLSAFAEDGPRSLRVATDRVVSVRHPLPCPVRVLSVE